MYELKNVASFDLFCSSSTVYPEVEGSILYSATMFCSLEKEYSEKMVSMLAISLVDKLEISASSNKLREARLEKSCSRLSIESELFVIDWFEVNRS